MPDNSRAIPFEAEVGREHLWWLTEAKAISLPEPPPLKNHGNYVASLGKLVKWMAKEAEALGVDIFCEFPGRALLYEDSPTAGRRVAGVRTGDKGIGKDGEHKANFEPGVDIRSQMTVLGEGPRGTLAKQLETPLGLTAGKNPQVYALGRQGALGDAAGRVRAGRDPHHGLAAAAGHFGGGFIYGMRTLAGRRLRLPGSTTRIPPTTRTSSSSASRPTRAIARCSRAATMAYYGAKAIPEGGCWAMPKLCGDGFCLFGDTGGFLNGARLKGIHLAMKSGMLAAETLFECLLAGDFSKERLAGYEQRFEASWASDRAVEGPQLPPGLRARRLRRHVQRGARHGDRRPRLRCSATGSPAEAGHERMRRLAASAPTTGKPAPLDFDGKLTFDKLADVYLSGTAHDEDQPVHLVVADTIVCVDRCAARVRQPLPALLPGRGLRDGRRQHGRRPASGCRSTPRTACTARPATSPTPTRSSLGDARGRRRPELRQDVAPRRGRIRRVRPGETDDDRGEDRARLQSLPDRRRPAAVHLAGDPRLEPSRRRRACGW